MLAEMPCSKSEVVLREREQRVPDGRLFSRDFCRFVRSPPLVLSSRVRLCFLYIDFFCLFANVRGVHTATRRGRAEARHNALRTALRTAARAPRVAAAIGGIAAASFAFYSSIFFIFALIPSDFFLFARVRHALAGAPLGRTAYCARSCARRSA